MEVGMQVCAVVYLELWAMSVCRLAVEEGLQVAKHVGFAVGKYSFGKVVGMSCSEDSA